MNANVVLYQIRRDQTRLYQSLEPPTGPKGHNKIDSRIAESAAAVDANQSLLNPHSERSGTHPGKD